VKNINQFLSKTSIRFLDHSNKITIFKESNNALTSFAIDDAIATTVGKNLAPPTVRMWVHDQTVVLGIPDSRLPYIEVGINYLQKQGYNIIIRNSGGLAVLIDKNVLNMSFILPNNNKLSIYDGYDLMYHFIQELFKEFTTEIKAYEINGSYCPGDYDLSIHGIKFAGISQRRVRNGVAVQIYLDVGGNSKERASIIKKFYELSKQDSETKYTYPHVNPNVMGTISDLLQTKFTIQQVINRIRRFIQARSEIVDLSLLHEEEPIFKKRLQQMNKRNEKIK